MINEFEEFLGKYYQNANIFEPNSIHATVHIRFELGGNISNGTESRVKQATNRANEIFTKAFPNPSSKIWLLGYEYENEFFDSEGKFKNYLYSLIDEDVVIQLNYYPVKTKTGYIEVDGDGTQKEEEIDVKIIIGELYQHQIKIEDLLEGIANFEMGLEPKVTQQVFFFDPETHNGFYMYDDRGCFVWSDSAEKIRNIYKEFNSWIVDYHRSDIEKFFQ